MNKNQKIEIKSVTDISDRMIAPEIHVKEFAIKETKVSERNGVPVGIIEGYASTFGNVDRADDIIERGAFDETVAEHKARNRPIRMLFQHGYQNLIGGFPADDIVIDDFGLKVRGEINLESELGRRSFSLAKQGVLTDMSIGFSISDWEIKDGIRIIKKIKLWEISMVDEPCNMLATITIVKRAVPFQDLPIAPDDIEWDEEKAIERIREFTKSNDEPTSNYGRSFLFADNEKAAEFDSYKLTIADVVNGELMIIPKAVLIAKEQILTKVHELTDAEELALTENLDRYLLKINPEPEPDKISLDKVKKLTERELEDALKKSGFSQGAAKFLLSRKTELDVDDEIEDDQNFNDWAKVDAELKALTEILSK